jgi:hypothetical protein
MPFLFLVEVWSCALVLGQIRCWIGLFFLTSVLWRSELEARWTCVSISMNKAVVREDPAPPGRVLAARRGGGRWSGLTTADSSREVWEIAMWSSCAAVLDCCCDFGPMRWPLHISVGSESSAAWMPSTLMAGRRLLPPWLPAAGASALQVSCWRKAFIFL